MKAPFVDPRFLPGAVFAGRFRVERTLGKGGMGIVFGAVDLELHRNVAIKVLYGDAAQDPHSIERFKREAHIASRLTGPNIVAVHLLGETEQNEPYIVMELLEGRDLDAAIVDALPMSVAEAVHIVCQACAGVATAHGAGLVHRDLKPANLYLARQPNGFNAVKVLDFGLTKDEGGTNGRLTQSTASLGTPQYMSPEQITSVKNVDARCDQHALGLILFELLTKQPAFQSETSGGLMVEIATKTPPTATSKRSDVPIGLSAAIARSLAKAPRDRFPDIGAFARAIAPFGGPEVAPLVDATVRALATAPKPPPDEAMVEETALAERPNLPQLTTMIGLQPGVPPSPSPAGLPAAWTGARPPSAPAMTHAGSFPADPSAGGDAYRGAAPLEPEVHGGASISERPPATRAGRRAAVAFSVGLLLMLGGGGALWRWGGNPLGRKPLRVEPAATADAPRLGTADAQSSESAMALAPNPRASADAASSASVAVTATPSGAPSAPLPPSVAATGQWSSQRPVVNVPATALPTAVVSAPPHLEWGADWKKH